MQTRARSLALLASLIFLAAQSCSDLGVEPDAFRPIRMNDEWDVSAPETQGLDRQKLAAGYDAMKVLPYAYSLLVVRNGYLVAEQYFNGNPPGSANRIMSVSKSILSSLVGLALEEGELDSLNQTVLDFFPEYLSPSLDARKRGITAKHLLTMRGGFDGDQQTYFTVHNSADWIRATIELPLVADPGRRMIYCTYGTHLLSGVLTRACGVSTYEFARMHLCDPLGVTIQFWETDPQGVYFGGNGMGLTPRDMARFGLLYLRNGTLDGKQIVPRRWVEESLANSTGWQNLTWGDVRNINYGYLWWLGEIGGARVYFALGHGGQLIVNVPTLDMIIVSTASPDFDWDLADEHERAILHVIAQYIVPAAGG